MAFDEPKYKAGSTVAQRAPIYLDVNKDPRARDQAYLNLYASRVGSPVIAVDGLTGRYLGFSDINGNVAANSGNATGANKGSQDPGTVIGIPTKGVPPTAVTNLKADYVGDDIVLTFDWDPNSAANANAYKFKVEIHDAIANSYYYMLADIGYDPIKFINASSINQTLTLLSKDIQSTGTDNATGIDIVGVAVSDIVNSGEYVTVNVTTPWASSLPAPELGAVTNSTDSYSIPITNYETAKALGAFDGVIVQENLTSISNQSGIDETKWTEAMPPFNANKINGFAPDDAPRWIRARFYQKNGGLSPISNIVKAEPLAFMPVNTNPAVQFTSSTIAWSGNDIQIGFVKPTTVPSGQSAAAQVKVKMVPFIGGVESTSLYAYYYHTIGDASDVSFKILALDLFGQFGAHYSKFVAYITAVSTQGVETTGSVIKVGPATRSSSLSAVYPTVGTPNVNSPTGIFRITSISNGYVVDFDLPAGATRLEVYEKSSAWTTVPTNDSNMIYSGLSPATIITPDNNKRYVIVRFYDDYGNESHLSMEKSGQESGSEVTPIDVGRLSLIENPIKIQTDGSIFAGPGDETVYPQVFFNKNGLFAYDAGGNRTTEIINNATSGSPTLITTSAQIANWTISPNKIENTLYGVGTNKNYAGLAANGTYAFWAGSDVAGGDANSKFSVSHTGIVTMRDVHIIGNPGDGSNTSLAIGGSDETAPFRVSTAGAMVASSATITGSITVNQQSYFNANVNIASGSYLISAGTGSTVKLGAEGLLALTGTSATTKVYSTPITVGSAFVSLWSKGALFGSTQDSGWLITDGVMKSSHITLDSGNEYIRIIGTNPANGLKLSYASGAASDYVIQSGAIDSGVPAFSVTHDGTVNAKKATIEGTVQSSIIKSTSKTGISDGNNGYYFNAAGDFEIKTAGAKMVFANSTFNLTTYSGGAITLAAPTTGGGDRAYDASSYGMFINSFTDPSTGSIMGGTVIAGLPVQGNIDMSRYPTNYLNAPPLGNYPRQRMIVEDVKTGVLKLGMAVYYRDSGAYGTQAPTTNTGVIGDLWVDY
jgi:hypothetical protein